MKIKLHFNRINMQRKLQEVWSAHTHKDCNPSGEVVICYKNKIIGHTVYNPDGKQPRAYIEFYGTVTKTQHGSIIDIAE